MAGFIDGIYFNECSYPGEVNLGKSYRKGKAEGHFDGKLLGYGD